MKVSVIIATKDRPDRLTVAVSRILNQKFDGELEVIIKDASADPHPVCDDPRVIYVPGPDDSIAQGFNQAAAHATGDVMHNANDDDLMRPGAIKSALKSLDQYDAMWTYGCLLYETEEPGGRRVQHRRDPHGAWPWDPEEMMRQNCVHQPTVFYRREAWEELGPFNETFRYAYDYEFWGRLGSRYTPVARFHYDAVYTYWPGSTSVMIWPEVQADADAIAAMWAEHGFGNRPTDLTDEKIRGAVRGNLDVLNRLESHLGCALCRGPLVGGRCAECQP